MTLTQRVSRRFTHITAASVWNRTAKTAFGYMDEKHFNEPVSITTANGVIEITSVGEARDILSSVEWPVRGTRHAEALDVCLKVLEGHRSTVEARTAVIGAAREAGALVK